MDSSAGCSPMLRSRSSDEQLPASIASVQEMNICGIDGGVRGDTGTYPGSRKIASRLRAPALVEGNCDATVMTLTRRWRALAGGDSHGRSSGRRGARPSLV